MMPSQFSRKSARTHGSARGFTLVESLVAMGILLVAIGAVFALSAQLASLLRQAKEKVAMQQLLQARIDQVRRTPFDDLATSTALSTKLLVSGAAGDSIANAGVSVAGMSNFQETVSVHALGRRLPADNTALAAATPRAVNETATVLNTDLDFKATATSPGAWTASPLPRLRVRRTGLGGIANTTVLTAADLRAVCQSVRVDVELRWSGAKGRQRQLASTTIVSAPGTFQ